MSGRRSRRAGRLALPLALALAGAARAQTPAPPLPDVPAGPAAIRGRVLHIDGGTGVADTPVLLFARELERGESLRIGRSDASGRFAFEGISNDPGTVYLVAARYDGIPFGGQRVVFARGELAREIQIQVTQRNVDPEGVRVLEARVELDRVGARLAVQETYRLENAGTATVYARAGERDAARPVLRATLPAGAEGFRADFPELREGLLRDGDALAFYGPVYPGEHEISWSYRLPVGATGAAIEKAFPTAADRVTVVHASGLRVTSDALAPVAAAPAPGGGDAAQPGGGDAAQPGGEDAADAASGDTDAGQPGRRTLAAGPVAAGTRIALAVELPPAQRDPGALSHRYVRVFLEHDAAALRVNEELHLRVSGDRPLVSDGEPLVRVALPEGAFNLRFSEETLAMGLTTGDTGGLHLLGPLPAGDAIVRLSYQLPTERGATPWTRRFGFEVPVLNVYATDTGVVLETERLHRRRPVRTPDRIYMVVEGFRIAADEAVSVAVRPLPARDRPSRGLAGAFVAVAAAAIAALLADPFLRGGDRTAKAAADEPALRVEREAIYASIRDLDHDHEVGKVTDEDYRTLRDALRTRAMQLLRRQRGEARAGASPAAAPACPACRAEVRAGDRFCPQCGARLEADPAAGRGARG